MRGCYYHPPYDPSPCPTPYRCWYARNLSAVLWWLLRHAIPKGAKR